MLDRQWCQDALEAGDGVQRHLCAGGGRHVDAAEGRRVVLVLRERLQHNSVLVGLPIDRRDLPLAKGIIEGIVDRLHGDAEAAGQVAVDADHGTQATLLGVRGDVAENV